MNDTPRQSGQDQTASTSEAPHARKKPINRRHLSREFVLQALYQWQVTADSVADLNKQYSEAEDFSKADATLFAALLKGAINDAQPLQLALQPHLDRPWHEVSPIERSILLLAGFELISCAATPYRVIINEAIELAKSYGGTDGHKYINGVLDKLAALVRADEIAYQKQGASAAPKNG